MHPHGCRFMGSRESKSGASVRGRPHASCKIYEPWVSCSLGRVFLKFPRRMAKRKSEAPKPFSPITALKHNSTTAGPSFSPLKVSPAVRTQPDGAVGDVHLWHSVAVKGVNGARSLKKQPFL